MNGIFDTMRERWKEHLTGGICKINTDGPKRRTWDCTDRKNDIESISAADQEADRLRRSMCQGFGRSCLWPDLSDPGNVYARDRVCLKTCSRLEKLALRYAAQGSPWEGDDGLKQEILDGLDFVYRNWYNESQRKGGEWWHREIGIPLCLNRIAVLLYEEMGPKRLSGLMRAVVSWACDPGVMCIEDTPETSTGANRAWKCLVLAGCGILTRDMARLEKAAASIGDVFRFTRSGDGFYEDGSFVQHLKFAYNGGYGISFLKTVSEYIYLTAHTPWQIKAHEDEMMDIWIHRSFAPFFYRGCFLNMVNGRQVAREEYEEDAAGQEAAAAILIYASTLPLERRERLEKSLHQWMETGSMETESAQSMAVSQERAYYLFAGMDRAVCRRKNYAVGISMCSERMGRYESIHGENLRGWHLSDGAIFLYNGDSTQFCGGFFPTVNACHINGTTADTLVREEKGVGFGLEPMPPNDWAGGCVLEGRYGSAGMELFAEGSSLTARKSWFLWEEEIVCLGAGISCAGGLGVVTVVENRKLPGAVSDLLEDLITADGKEVFLTQGRGCRKEGVQTLHQKGLVPNSDIGYYFPHRADIDLLLEKRTDCWKNINSLQTSGEPISNTFVEMIWDHGKDPVQERYEYVLLPGKKKEELKEYAKNPPVEILSNTARVQAVRHNGLKITGLHFWEKDGGEAAEVSCSARAAVLIREKEDSWVVSVSDPTWNNQEGILLRLPFGAACVVRKPPQVQVLKLFPRAEIRVDTACSGNACSEAEQFHADCSGRIPDRGTSFEFVLEKRGEKR